ncbi:hypothetical protein ACTFIR_005686 [Dictyostelium discoideum]
MTHNNSASFETPNRSANIVEKILVYETLHRNCVFQFCATGKISSRYIRTCILNAGGTNSNENKVVLSKLVYGSTINVVTPVLKPSKPLGF